MGNKYVETASTTMEGMKSLVSSGNSVKVGFSIGFEGSNALDMGFGNSKENEAIKSFMDETKSWKIISTGAPLPSGSTPELVRDTWMKATVTSTGLTGVGEFTLISLDTLLQPQYLQDVNEDIAALGLGLPVLTTAQLAGIRQELVVAIEGWCKASGAAKCNGPSDDNKVPSVQVSTVELPGTPASNKGAKVNFNDQTIAGLFGKQQLTLDMEVAEVRTWWKSLPKQTPTMVAWQVLYRDGNGVLRETETVGPTSGAPCIITVPQGQRITQVDTRAGAWVDYIQLYIDHGPLKSTGCGNQIGGGNNQFTILNNWDYLIGFAGRASSATIDSLGFVKAVKA
jgi:hypothetical protein